MIVDGLDEEEPFNLDIMVVSEGTESNCAMPTDSIILKRDAWNYFCLGYSGVVKQALNLSFTAFISHPDGEYEIISHEKIITGGDTEPDVFQAFVPSNINSSEAVLKYVWSYTLHGNDEIIDSNNTSFDIILPAEDSNYDVEVENSRAIIAEGSSRPLNFKITNYKPNGFAFSAWLIDTSGKEIGFYSGNMTPLSVTNYGMSIDTSLLEFGDNQVSLVTSIHGNESQLLTEFTLEKTVSKTDIDIVSAGWSELDSIIPFRPNSPFSVEVELFNYGPENSSIAVDLSCTGAQTFQLSTQVLASEKGEINASANFTFPGFEVKGHYSCSILNGNKTLHLLAKSSMPWDVKPILSFSNVTSSSVIDDEYGIPVQSSDEEKIFINASILNHGESVESFDWELQASSVFSGQSILLGQGRMTIPSNETGWVFVERSVETCISQDWNLDLRATDRYGETYSQTLLQGFRSVRSNMDVSLTKDLGKFEVVSGDYVPVTIVAEGLAESSQCAQNQTVELMIEQKSDDNFKNLYIQKSQVTVIPGITSTSLVELYTGEIEKSGYYYVKARIKDPVTGQTVSTEPLRIEIEVEDAVLEVECDIPDSLDSRSTVVSCELDHQIQRSIAYKVIPFIDGAMGSSQSGWIAPAEEVTIDLPVYFETWESHNVEIRTSVLIAGEWVEQTKAHSQTIELFHPNDTTEYVRAWRTSPDIPRSGSELAVEVDFVCSSKYPVSYLSARIYDLNEELISDSRIVLEPIEIGVLSQQGMLIEWPTSCDYFVLEIVPISPDGIEWDLPETLMSSKTLTACPPQLPDYIIEEISKNTDDEIMINVTNRGVSASVSSSVTVYGDGKIMDTFSIPAIEGNSTYTLDIKPEISFSTITAVVDSGSDITERGEGSNNVITVDLEYQVLTFNEADLDGDGELSSLELEFGNVVDSDGDGISDETEQIGWTVITTTNIQQLNSQQKFIDDLLSGREYQIPQFDERTVYGSSSSIDSDGDGITDYGEMLEGTDPQNNDTDGDGLDDLYEVLNEAEEPLVVELNKPIIQVTPPDMVENGWFEDKYRIKFTITELNLNSVEIKQYEGDEKIGSDLLSPEFIEYNSDGSVTSHFEYTYTVSDLRLIDNVHLQLYTTDNFGQEHNETMVNHSSIFGRVTNAFFSLAVGITEFIDIDLITYGIASTTGLVYGLVHVLKDTFEFITNIPSIIKYLLSPGKVWDDVSEVLGTLKEYFLNTSISKFIEDTKKLGNKVYKLGLELSPFENENAKKFFLAFFVAGYVVGTIAVEAMITSSFVAGFKTFQSVRLNTGTGGILSQFVSHFADSMKSFKSGIIFAVKHPIKSMKSFTKGVLSLPKMIILGPIRLVDWAVSGVLIGKIISKGKLTGLFGVMKNVYMYTGGKLGLAGVKKVERALDAVDTPAYKDAMKNKGSKKVKVRGKEMDHWTLFARQLKHILRSDYLDNWDDFHRVPNGQQKQQAAMKKLVSDLSEKGHDYRQLKGVVGEYSKVGVYSHGDQVTEILPAGHCSNPAFCKTKGDTDLWQTTYDSDGTIISKKRIEVKKTEATPMFPYERKFGEEGGKKGTSNENDYQREMFEDNFMPEEPDGFENYKKQHEDMGYSDEELRMHYEEDMRCMNDEKCTFAEFHIEISKDGKYHMPWYDDDPNHPFLVNRESIEYVQDPDGALDRIKERIRQDDPALYQRLVDEGRLDDYAQGIVDTRWNTRIGPSGGFVKIPNGEPNFNDALIQILLGMGVVMDAAAADFSEVDNEQRLSLPAIFILSVIGVYSLLLIALQVKKRRLLANQ